MSDFTSNFWSVYVRHHPWASSPAPSCCWVQGARRARATADNSTGHVWDEDLREMNNPAALVGGMFITIVFFHFFTWSLTGPG